MLRQLNRSAGVPFAIQGALQTGQAVRQTIIRNLISGEYNNPVRIVAFNTEEGWSRDVTAEFFLKSGTATKSSRQDSGNSSRASLLGRSVSRRPNSTPSRDLSGNETPTDALVPHGVCVMKDHRTALTEAVRLACLELNCFRDPRCAATPEWTIARLESLLRDPRVNEAMAVLSPEGSPSIVPDSRQLETTKH